MRVERGLLPPSSTIEIEALSAAVARWETARDQAKAADRQYAELQRGNARAQAEARDAEQLAGSIERDEPAPEPRFVREFETALATAKREQQARILVERASWDAVQAAFREHGDELARRAARDFEQARAKWVRWVKGGESRYAELERTKGLLEFATSTDGVYRPGGAYYTIAEVQLPPVNPDSGGTSTLGVLAGLEMCGQSWPLHPEGVNPDALRDLPPSERHIPPHLQGRMRAVVPAGGPADG